MSKKILFISIITAMLIGMFGVMGQGAVAPVQAQEEDDATKLGDKLAGMNLYDAFAASTAFPNDLGIGNRSIINVVGLDTTVRELADPTDCLAGDHTGWGRFLTSNPAGTDNDPRYLAVAVRAEFDASVVITNDANTAVLGCFNVAADATEMLVVPITAGNAYRVMIAEKQGYPLVAGERFDMYVMQSREAKPVIVRNLALIGTPTWQTPDGLPTDLGLYTEAAPDGNGVSFFDLADGPNHMSWTATVGGLNWVLFRTVDGPAVIVLNPVSTATVATYVTTDGGTANYNLWLAPSAWQVAEEINDDFTYRLGTIVAGCQGVPPQPGGWCSFRTEPGTFDAQIVSQDIPNQYYLLSITDRPLTNVLPPGEVLDFRAEVLPQAIVQVNKENAGFALVDFLVRGSETIGDWIFWMDNDDSQLHISANLVHQLEPRLLINGWYYVLEPIYFDGLGASSHTFTGGQEVNIRLDSGTYDNMGVGIAPYNFDTSISMSGTDPIEISTTDFVDVVGNTLIRVAAPDDTLAPVDTDTLRDQILPHTMAIYGFMEDVVVSEYTWDTTTIEIPASEIGRYYAQRALLTGGNVRAGEVVSVNPYSWLGVGFVRGDSVMYALSPTDVGHMTHWSWSWVMAMYEAGLTTGLEPGIYGPDVVMQRSEMAVFLSRLLQAYGIAPAGTAAPFDDVDATHWAVAEIEHLRELGITDGIGDNNFAPDAEVTRAEMAKFIQLTFRIIEVNNPGSFPHWDQNQNVFNPGTTFQDVPMEHWANIWIEELFFDGLTNGCASDQLNLWFCPEDSVTRGQMAKFIMSAHQTDAVTQAFWPVLAPEK